MSIRNTGEPPVGQPLSITRNDLETVRRMVRCHGVYDEADDVAQEVVIVAARYRRPIEVPPGHTAAETRELVLAGIVRRQVARHRTERARRLARGGEPVRTRPHEQGAEALERLAGAAPSVEDQILERSRSTLLRAAIDQLQHEAPGLYSVMVAELSGASIAAAAVDLGICVSTAYTRSLQGRAAVRAQLRRWEVDTRCAMRMWLDAMTGGRERCT